MTPTENEETKTDEPAEVQPDIMPEPDDDVEVELEPAAPAEEAPHEPAPEEAVDRNEFDVARDDIAALYRQQRDAENLAEKEAEAEPEVAEAAPEGAAETEETTEQPQEIAEEVTEDPIVTLKIDGVEVKRSQSELIAIAQKAGAVDNRLQQANELVDEMKALKSEAPADQSVADAPTDADVPTEPDAQTTGPDPEKLSSIAEQLQVGDQDDAVKAVSELLALAQEGVPAAPDQSAQQVLSPEERKAEYRDFIVQENTEKEFQDSLVKFGTDFPEISGNVELQQISISTAARLMQEEMSEKNLISEAELAQIASDPSETSNIYREFKNAGQTLRSYHEVFDEAGKHVTSRYGKAPAEAPSTESRAAETVADKTQERTELKRAAQQQPRQAAVKSQPDKGPKPKTKEQVVEEMRAARNYPSTM